MNPRPADPLGPTIEAMNLIDAICDRFERDWMAGLEPRTSSAWFGLPISVSFSADWLESPRRRLLSDWLTIIVI